MPWTPGQIEWDKIELYIKAGSNQKKIAQALGISIDTLERRTKEKYEVSYADFAASLKSAGVLLIEAKQFEQAMKGNIKMLIHLGRIRCGQDAGIVYAQPPNEQLLEMNHEVMKLKHENVKLRLQIEENAHKPQTR